MNMHLKRFLALCVLMVIMTVAPLHRAGDVSLRGGVPIFGGT